MVLSKIPGSKEEAESEKIMEAAAFLLVFRHL